LAQGAEDFSRICVDLAFTFSHDAHFFHGVDGVHPLSIAALEGMHCLQFHLLFNVPSTGKRLPSQLHPQG
jgi:hypothetical protein